MSASLNPKAGFSAALFAFFARNLSLITIGLLQYIGPSCAFFLGVFVYGEHFSSAHLVTFGCIWGALALYSGERLVRLRRRGRGVL